MTHFDNELDKVLRSIYYRSIHACNRIKVYAGVDDFLKALAADFDGEVEQFEMICNSNVTVFNTK